MFDSFVGLLLLLAFMAFCGVLLSGGNPVPILVAIGVAFITFPFFKAFA